MSHVRKTRPVALSIGILACNEGNSIEPTLAALFRQSVFAWMAERHARCEILVLANACTDRTAAVVRDAFTRMEHEHPWAGTWRARVIEIVEPGRNHAWNRFVHEFSAVEAQYLVSMHADILLHHRDALCSLVSAIAHRPLVDAASGRRCEDGPAGAATRRAIAREALLS